MRLLIRDVSDLCFRDAERQKKVGILIDSNNNNLPPFAAELGWSFRLNKLASHDHDYDDHDDSYANRASRKSDVAPLGVSSHRFHAQTIFIHLINFPPSSHFSICSPCLLPLALVLRE